MQYLSAKQTALMDDQPAHPMIIELLNLISPDSPEPQTLIEGLTKLKQAIQKQKSSYFENQIRLEELNKNESIKLRSCEK